MWDATWADPLTTFLHPFGRLIQDRRTAQTFTAIVRGLLTAGTTLCSQIAAHTSRWATTPYGERTIRRFLQGQTTQRSPDLDPEHLTACLRERTLERLRTQAPDEVWLILDGSELRKPHARSLPHLDKVPALDGHLVPGYWTLNVIAVIPGYRGVLYQRVYSTREPGFRSEPLEVQQALRAVGAALQEALPTVRVTWIMDRGFDDIAVWRTIWTLKQRLVCRVQHSDRRVQYRTPAGWIAGHLEQAVEQAPVLAQVETSMEVRLAGQRAAKRQVVTVELRAGAVRLSYERADRTEMPTREQVQRTVWVVHVRIRDCEWAPWLLVTDGPVDTAGAVQRVFAQYRQRWSIEDALKYTKTCLDWEAVQMMDLRSIRMLVALAWVAAGFLYEVGVSWEEEDVRLIARLGGWEERKDRPPGRIVLTRGLARLLDMLTTEALLEQYRTDQGRFPPQIAAFLRQGPPRDGL